MPETFAQPKSTETSSPIVVAMSGGVDSSAVAALLKREGRQVIGMTMQLWNQRRLPELMGESATGRCCSLDDVYDARHVAAQLDVPFYVVNFEKEFEREIVEPFVAEYLAGRTPIPCTLCNSHIKFDKFFEMADAAGAEKVATGHYARLNWNADSGRYEMRTSVDAAKDQTYFLFGLSQSQLARSEFPLGGMTKPQVRELARECGLAIAEKSESFEICFVPNGDYAGFLEAYLKDKGEPLGETRGEVLATDGHKLGDHDGVHHYTVGQRKGLGIAAPQPLYVIETNPAARTVTVGTPELLMKASLIARDINWVSWANLAAPARAQVKIRNRHAAAQATLYPLADGRVEARFDEPQRAVTPGQAAVFYDGDLVLGGGWIE